MSICTSQSTTSILVDSMSRLMVGGLAELNVASEDISGGYEDIDTKIRVGDLVRKIKDARTSSDPGIVRVPFPHQDD